MAQDASMTPLWFWELDNQYLWCLPRQDRASQLFQSSPWWFARMKRNSYVGHPW
jgi:hypothetical protein